MPRYFVMNDDFDDSHMVVTAESQEQAVKLFLTTLDGTPRWVKIICVDEMETYFVGLSVELAKKKECV